MVILDCDARLVRVVAAIALNFSEVRRYHFLIFLHRVLFVLLRIASRLMILNFERIGIVVITTDKPQVVVVGY